MNYYKNKRVLPDAYSFNQVTFEHKFAELNQSKKRETVSKYHNLSHLPTKS